MRLGFILAAGPQRRAPLDSRRLYDLRNVHEGLLVKVAIREDVRRVVERQPSGVNFNKTLETPGGARVDSREIGVLENISCKGRDETMEGCSVNAPATLGLRGAVSNFRLKNGAVFLAGGIVRCLQNVIIVYFERFEFQ